MIKQTITIKTFILSTGNKRKSAKITIAIKKKLMRAEILLILSDVK